MRNVKISKRLETVAECVDRGSKVADIGCDHAYTAIYMIEKGIATKVVAMDINKGPLQKANYNIDSYGYTQYIETRLSDGAAKLHAGEVDTILISGMGGRLTNKILSDSIDVIKKCDQLVLQPQSEIHLVRQYLRSIGFYIEYENMLIEDGKYYVIINARNEYILDNNIGSNSIIDNGENDNERLFYKYGKYLLETKNEILEQFLLKELRKNNDIINDLRKRKNLDGKLLERITELEEEHKLISEALKYYEV